MLANVIAATLLGGLGSLLCAAALGLRARPESLRRLIGFAAGVLLAVALLDILPEALARGISPSMLGSITLAGIVLLHLLERISLWCHRRSDPHAQAGARVSAIVVGDSMHNFVDGVLIAAAFATDTTLGWTATVAVVAHEIPQEIGDFLMLREAGLSRARALYLNGASSLASVAGGLAGYFALERMQQATPYLLAMAGGTFIYIAMADLLPLMRAELRHRAALAQSGAMALGIGLIVAGNQLAH